MKFFNGELDPATVEIGGTEFEIDARTIEEFEEGIVIQDKIIED